VIETGGCEGWERERREEMERQSHTYLAVKLKRLRCHLYDETSAVMGRDSNHTHTHTVRRKTVRWERGRGERERGKVLNGFLFNSLSFWSLSVSDSVSLFEYLCLSF
jgi:hypothetical protein